MLSFGRGEGAIFRLGQNRSVLELVPFVKHGAHTQGRAPLLFIHGIEFATPEETLSDLVWPMLDILGPQRTADREIYVFVWNSLLTNNIALSDLFDASMLERLRFAFSELPKCRSYLRDVERRAREAAHCLLPFALEWSSESRVGPTVITHSMGSLVWAETLKLLVEATDVVAKPGIWWSLQPAMHRRAFTEEGEYNIVPKIYTGSDSSRAVVWYSRLDLILSTIYLLSKRGFALGQYGCPVGRIPQRDVTSWVKEAHGMRHIRSSLGDFFERIKPILTEEADLYGI